MCACGVRAHTPRRKTRRTRGRRANGPCISSIMPTRLSSHLSMQSRYDLLLRGKTIVANVDLHSIRAHYPDQCLVPGVSCIGSVVGVNHKIRWLMATLDIGGEFKNQARTLR